MFVAVKYIASLGKIYREKVKKISVRNLHRARASPHRTGGRQKAKKNIDTSVEVCYSVTMKIGDRVRIKNDIALGVRDNGTVVRVHEGPGIVTVEWLLHDGGLLYQSELTATLEFVDEDR